MARYFDADKVESIIDCAGDLQEAKSCISMLQTEDVAPVIHAEWIERDDAWGGIYYDCSVCNESWTTIEGTPFDNGMKYCPHCGAKMDKE